MPYGKKRRLGKKDKFGQKDMRKIRSAHAKRSSRSQGLDEVLKARLAETPEQWMRQPDEFDVKGVDLPEKKKQTKKKKVPVKKRPGKKDRSGGKSGKISERDMDILKQAFSRHNITSAKRDGSKIELGLIGLSYTRAVVDMKTGDASVVYKMENRLSPSPIATDRLREALGISASGKVDKGPAVREDDAGSASDDRGAENKKIKTKKKKTTENKHRKDEKEYRKEAEKVLKEHKGAWVEAMQAYMGAMVHPSREEMSSTDVLFETRSIDMSNDNLVIIAEPSNFDIEKELKKGGFRNTAGGGFVLSMPEEKALENMVQLSRSLSEKGYNVAYKNTFPLSNIASSMKKIIRGESGQTGDHPKKGDTKPGSRRHVLFKINYQPSGGKSWIFNITGKGDGRFPYKGDFLLPYERDRSSSGRTGSNTYKLKDGLYRYREAWKGEGYIIVKNGSYEKVSRNEIDSILSSRKSKTS